MGRLSAFILEMKQGCSKLSKLFKSGQLARQCEWQNLNRSRLSLKPMPTAPSIPALKGDWSLWLDKFAWHIEMILWSTLPWLSGRRLKVGDKTRCFLK